MFNMSNPLSGLHGEQNGATWAIMQRQMDLDNAINEFVSLACQGYDISDDYLQGEVFEHNNIERLSDIEENYIVSSIDKLLGTA